MRRLYIRFLEADEKKPMATRSYSNRIPDDVLDEIMIWAARGGLLWGHDRSRLTINVIRRGDRPIPVLPLRRLTVEMPRVAKDPALRYKRIPGRPEVLQ